MDGKVNGEVNNKSADNTYSVNTDIINKGWKNGGRSNARRQKSDVT